MREEGLDLHLLEHRLGQIRGVISARVVTGEDGEVGEIHVMADSQRTPKQLVRDIESLFLLHFKTRLDYRKISIVQLEGERSGSMGRIRLKVVDNKQVSKTQSRRWSVILEYNQQDVTGQWDGASSATEAEGAAQATLGALQGMVGSAFTLSLREAKVAQLEGAAAVIAAVSLGAPPRQETLIGSSFIKDNVAEASARAVLSAVNRRLPFTLE